MADVWSTRLEKIANGQRLLVGLDFITSTDAIAAYLGVLRSGLPVLVVEPGQLADGTRMDAVWQPDIHITPGPDKKLTLQNRMQRSTNVMGASASAHVDLALLLSTSGSTGDPKLVRLSHNNVASNAAAIAEYLKITPNDRAMITLPLFYSYGLSVLNSYLVSGAALILNQRSVVDPLFWQDVRHKGATSMALVPHQFNLLEGSGFTGTDTPSLRYITQAGGKLDGESVRRFNAMGKAGGWDLVLMYGQTEAAPRISYVPPAALPDAADTIGIPIPGGGIRLLDEKGTEIMEPGRPGELVYSGPNVMMGYAESRHDLARDAEVSELRTGDIAELTVQGFYRIVGRMKRFVKIAGLRLSLDQIEALLHDKGIPAHAVAIDDRLVLLHAVVGAGEATRETVADEYGLPLSEIRTDFVAETPVLASGKPDHKALHRIAADVLTRDAARPKATGQSLTEVLKLATRARIVGPGDSFNSLGGDSLSYLQMQIALEERLGVAPPGWEALPLAKLEALTADTVGRSEERSGYSTVGIDVLLRILAISLVVIQHATDYPITGGVWVLIVLMGFSAARFQMQSIAERQALRLGIRMLYPILPLYFLLLFAYEAFRGDVPITFYLLLGEYNLLRSSLLTVYWFVSFYVKVVAILMLFATLPSARRLLVGAPWATPAVATCILLIIQATLLMSGGYVIDKVSTWPHEHYTTRGFIECLPFFLLGWIINQMKGRRQILATVMLAAFTLALFLQFQTRVSSVVFVALCLSLLALNPATLLPTRIARFFQILASVTLFVYLLHQIVITPMYNIDLPDWIKAPIALAVSFLVAWLAKITLGRTERALLELATYFRKTRFMTLLQSIRD